MKTIKTFSKNELVPNLPGPSTSDALGDKYLPNRYRTDLIKCQTSSVLPQWFDSDTPESLPIPDNYRDKMNPFEMLMLLRCFRVDRIYRALTDYITATMGEEYITPPVIRLLVTVIIRQDEPLIWCCVLLPNGYVKGSATFILQTYLTNRNADMFLATLSARSLDMIFEQTTPFSPVVFILSPGSDPTADLMKLADRCGFGGGKFKYLSLGQGQEGVSAQSLGEICQ